MEPLQGSPRVLSVPEAADLLRVSTRTIYEWLGAGKLPGRKIGKVWRLREDLLMKFLAGDGSSEENDLGGEG
jgi:excisionase family DNA binding protein